MEPLRVIDSDGHVQEHDADVRPHMEEPYCKRRGSLLPSDEWDSSMYGALGLKVRDVAMRLRDMDQETIDTAVLFPTSAFHMTRLAEKDYAAAYCRGLQ
jgi:hypothetical protein